MTGHRVVIEAGPGVIRRLCCGTGEVADVEAAAALDDIDEPVTLLDDQPVSVPALWRTLLQSLACPGRPTAAVLVIHPSWWSAARVDLVTHAADVLADDVFARPRSGLLAAGASVGTVVVEIAARLVAVTTPTTNETVAERRCGPPDRVADAVARRAAALTRDPAGSILIDGPAGVGGAPALAAMIAERLRAMCAETRVELADETRLAAAVRQQPARAVDPQPADGGRRRRCAVTLAASGVLLGLVALGVGNRIRPDAPVEQAAPTTFLVEGRVAVQAPADWPVRRITGGPGSARVEVTSPSDPELMLHVTQSLVPGGTLAGAAESLERAMRAEPAGVFTDFNPAGISAGRPAVTYREVRTGHHIDWTVLVDGAVRISIGCQSRPGSAASDAARQVCEQAVRSARALH